MKMFLAALLLALFAYDVAADMRDADCHAAAGECHACVCGPHAVQPRSAQGAALPATTERRTPSSGIRFAQRLSDKSLFHPPKTSA